MIKRNCYFIALLCITLVSGCQTVSQNSRPGAQHAAENTRISREDINKLFIVDCLLPGVVRQLGGQFTYLTPRRPIRSSAINCEIRGGEYTAHDRADYRTSLKLWLKLAKEGNAEAQVNVGEIYEKGLGVMPDYELARLWYEKAATRGNARAEINLGYLYEKGLGVRKDLVKAINWYRKASGLVNDDLKFASNIEIAIAASTSKEVQQLKQQVIASKEQARVLRTKLADKHQQLDHKQQQLSASFKRLKQLQYQNRQYLAGENSRNVERQALYQDEIRALQQDISQQQVVINRLHLDLEQNKGQLNEKVLLASANVSDDLTKIAGPSINILQQPLVLTRGLPTLKLPVNNAEYHITGRVTAPAGLLGFTVNGRKYDLNTLGRFELQLPASEMSSKVRMVAIDKGGRVARLAFAIEPASIIPMQPSRYVKTESIDDDDSMATINFGNYYALIIGNNAYKQFPKLKTAVHDAKKTESILRSQYGFKTKLLLNADRYSILTALNELSNSLGTNDNLLIYYAGHGEINAQNQRGYWLPIDAETGNTANWISNLDITDMLNVIPAKHILVVADSCYSGTMSSTAQTRMSLGLENMQQRARWIKVMTKTRARIIMTSGGVKPVLDAGGGKHSVFARAFLSALEQNSSVIEGYSLYQQISNNVQNLAAQYNMEQIPRYAPVKHGGGLGEFFFVPKKR
jgi:hypothetical protein